MTTKQQVKSLKAFAAFFNAIGKDEDAANAHKWASELEEQSVRKRIAKVRRFTRADMIRARGMGVLLT